MNEKRRFEDDGVHYEDQRGPGEWEEDEWVAGKKERSPRRKNCKFCGGFSVIESEGTNCRLVKACKCGRTCL